VEKDNWNAVLATCGVPRAYENDPKRAVCERAWRQSGILFERSPREPAGELFYMALKGWVADYPDPDNFLRVGFRKEMSGWDGIGFGGLVARARRILDQTQRVKLYQEADRMLIEEAVVLPLVYGMTHLLVKPWIKRVPISPMQDWFLKDVVIEPH